MLNVSIIIRTLNEEKNIEECLLSCIKNNVKQIIVSDGFSIDNTKSIVFKYMRIYSNIVFIEGKKGLIAQRNNALKNLDKNVKYIAIVDADDRLDKLCISRLVFDLKRDNAHAVQAKHKSYEIYSGKKLSYWEKAMAINLNIINDESKGSNNLEMVGRPALYESNKLFESINLNCDDFTSAHEDADLSYSLKQNNAIFTYGTGITYRKHIEKFSLLLKRWMSYGSGDAKFIKKHPLRFKNIIFHLVINYPIIRGFKCIRFYSIKYLPFFVLQGVIRFVGLCKYFLFGIGNMDNYKD